MGVLCVEHANVLELCYIELLSGDGSPYSILSGNTKYDYNCKYNNNDNFAIWLEIIGHYVTQPTKNICHGFQTKF